MNLIQRLVKLVIKLLSKLLTPKTWEVSQQYEWKATQEFMQTKSFSDLIENYRSNKFNSLVGYRDPSIVKEFFANSVDSYEQFLVNIVGKARLDIGPCISTPLRQWGDSDNFVIEPLVEDVIALQKKLFGFSLFDGMKCFNSPAEKTIDSLINRIDGVIYCRNCIDHSPDWPFILVNISKYAAKGCYLMLWNDLNHYGTADDGHYDITTDSTYFKSLIESLGFKIINEYVDDQRSSLNYGCLAIKI
jgi:hypothetical protein